jgi:hypothetical protein
MATKTRTRDCEQCHESFTYEVGIGRDRRLCSDFCRTKKRHAASKTRPLCVVEGCHNNRSYSSGLCNACYVRGYRGGDAFVKPPVVKRAYRSVGTNGYVIVWDTTHPLSRGFGNGLFEHRKVLYDAIGPGPHPCHWCSVMVDWIVGKCVKGSLVPDHLDGNRVNNALSNLVPSCNRCNASRGSFMAWVREHKDDPILWEMYERARAKVSA